MNTKLKKITEWAIGGLIAFSLVFLIAFENKEQDSKRCKSLQIDLSGENDQFFISEDDILKHVTNYGNKPFEGKLLSNIDLSELEQKVMEIKQIELCEAFGDLQGNIIIHASPYIPYARILGTDGRKDKYMDKKGAFFPLSKYHSERVLLLSGNYFNKLKNLEEEENATLLLLIKTIKENEFWNSQISQLDIHSNGQISMVPLMGNQIIEFGKAEKVEQKLKKLEVFYKQIMASNNWDNFSRVNVSYANQIVCE